jgi:hypothetical protein
MTDDGGPSWQKLKIKVDADAEANATEEGCPTWPKPNDVNVANAMDDGTDVMDDGGPWPKPKAGAEAAGVVDDVMDHGTEAMDDGDPWSHPNYDDEDDGTAVDVTEHDGPS